MFLKIKYYNIIYFMAGIKVRNLIFWKINKTKQPNNN